MTTLASQELLRELENRGRETGTLPDLLAFYHQLLGFQDRVSLGLEEAQPIPPATRPRQPGQPLLGFDELTLDWSRLPGLFEEATAIFAAYPALFGGISRESQAGAKSLFDRETARAWFEGTGPPSGATASGLNPALLREIVRATLKPWLTSHARACLGLVDQANWRRGY